MFKPLSQLIHKTPWWGLLLSGAGVLLLLVLFALPLQVMQVSSREGTAQEKRAIQHEIEQAFKDGGLSVAEGVLGTMRERASDPERRRELDRVLIEIARARQDDPPSAEMAAREAALEAIDARREAAQEELDKAQEAREAVQESRDQALESLRSKGLDVSGAEKSFADMLQSAKDKESTARRTLEAAIQEHEQLAQQPLPVASAPMAPPSAPVAAHLRDDIRQRVVSDLWRAGVGSALILAFIPLFVMLLVGKYFIDRSHKALAFAERKQEEAQTSDIQRRMTEARLQALQAQVEPHFLYNTLANVQALTEVDPPAAHTLVGHLIDYLRAALPKMRESTSTVGQELERVRAYLNILKMRMGERLHFDIEADESIRALPFPPMMLPTLVENAIKHGLEPKREGGRIDVRVTRTAGEHGADRLLLQVSDTGQGLRDAETQVGGGVGLTNLRERLEGLYGNKARFSLEAQAQGGVMASLEVPVQPVSAPATLSTHAEPLRKGPLDNAPTSIWGRFWRTTRTAHGVWAHWLSRSFVVLMSVLLVAFFAALIAVLAGWVPVQVHNFRVDGIEGMAIGSLGLLLSFGVIALVSALVLLLLYGLGFLFAGLLVFIPAVIVISLAPAWAPIIVLGLFIYWLVRRKGRSAAGGAPSKGSGV